MKTFIKKNSDLLLFILIGLIFGVSTVYGATIYFNSNQVGYNNSISGLKNTNNSNVDNVADAIDALYRKVVNVECASGYSKQNATSNGYSCMKPICTRVTNSADLHAEICSNKYTSSNCRADGYAQGETITYGNAKSLGTALETGDAFDCDVNNDGIINKDESGNSTERFYYVSDYFDTNSQSFDTTRAALIYYKNFVNGQASDDGVAYYGTSSAYDNWHGPTTAISSLPVASSTPTGNQWRDDLLKTADRKIQACSDDNCTTLSNSTTGGTITYTTPIYNGKAARLLTIPELLKTNCLTLSGESGIVTTGALSKCNFLMERTYYANQSGDWTFGPWLENPRSADDLYAWSVDGYYRSVVSGMSYRTFEGARPAIDVLYSDILY